MPQHTILVVEDDEILGDNIRTSLQRNGWDAQLAGSSEEALEMLRVLHPAVVLTDFDLPGISGIELIGRVREAEPDAKVIMMTGDGNVPRAVEAMQAGACDYCIRPPVQAELKLLIERAIEARRMEQILSFYQNREAQDGGLAALIGNSRPMQAMKALMRQLLDAEAHMAANDRPVMLISGEIGTGKKLVARALHVDGMRGAGPFVEVNCASIPSHLLEAELFGHEKGASTDAHDRRTGLVEAAEGGTLFLDEIGEMDLALQAKLLKLLEDRTIRRLGSVKEIKVNLRIVSTTSRDLEQMVREGKFRSDLYSRLRIVNITVPPLRQRGDDIAALARHFLALHGRPYGKPGLQFNAEALAVLKGYAWPGNVRELRNMLEQTVLLAGGKVVTPNQLAICPGLSGPCDRNFQTLDSYCMSVPAEGVNVPDVERDLVIKMLDKTDWNVTKSARLLGLTRDMLRYRIEKLGLERPQR